jgi:hypothetical protein
LLLDTIANLELTTCFSSVRGIFMITFRMFQGLCITCGLLAGTGHYAAAAPAVFVKDGRLLMVEQRTTRTVEPRMPTRGIAGLENGVSEYWGALDNGRLVVTLKPSAAPELAEADDHHWSVHSPGSPAVIVGGDGVSGELLCTNVLRAYPAPVGGRVALVSPGRELSIWQNDRCTTVTAPGKVSNAGWSPDGRFLVVSVYPPDWSEGSVSEASTTADFLRLQNADLYMYDAERGEFVSQLTSDPGTEYGAFFSRDGRQLYYTWLHITEDRGGLMRLDLDRDNGTSASAPAVQLTQAGNDAGETPLGRVTTYLWANAGSRLVFEAGRPDGSGEIWSTNDNGTSSTRLAAGRKPQAIDDTTIVFMGSSGTPQVIRPEAAR